MSGQVVLGDQIRVVAPQAGIRSSATALTCAGIKRPPLCAKVDGAGFVRFRANRTPVDRAGVPFPDVHANPGGPAAGGAGEPSELARRLLAGSGDRWDHTLEVAACALSVAAVVPDEDRRLLVDAAWLHDIGYSPEVSRTGFHPLDGARYLMSVGASADLVGAVAHHSCALFEAEERGLASELETFRAPSGAVMDALAYADMTTGPTGRGMSVEDRLEEILERYGPDDPVHRAISRARVDLVAAVRRTENRLAAKDADHPM
jgi:putative nucleotidyltransferase with HDIG domain